MKSKTRKIINVMLAVAMIMSILPALGGFTVTAADAPLFPSTGPENLALRVSAANNPYGVILTVPTANGGAPVNMINGSIHTTSATIFNTWGATPGTATNRYFITLSWPEPFVITGTSALWWIFTDNGVHWPVTVFIEYSTDDIDHSTLTQTTGTNGNAAQSTRLANMEWTRIGPVGVEGNGTPGAGSGGWVFNGIWNNFEFPEPVVARHIRLSVQANKTSGTSPGFGVNQWNVYGFQDPLQADIAWLRGQLNLTEIVTDVALPAEGPNGTVFSYVSSDTNYFGHDGRITRPAIGQPNATGTLEVTATFEEETIVETLNWSVRHLLSDRDIVDLDLAWINIGGTVNRTTNFSLPTIGPEGATITWDSGGSEYLWADGTVLRPPQGESAAAEVLTATVSFGGVVETETWEVTIPAWPEGGRRIVSHEPVEIDQPRLTAPKLPNEVMVTYSDGESEMRRVRWGRSSVANQQTDADRAVGVNYNITGNVMGDGNGDGFVVTANVTVVGADRVNDNVPSNRPVARALPLHAVTIDNDPDGRANALTQNRTGWTTYITNLNVTRYLHPFRTAYGLSTTGYQTPTGWTGKLRGFGSGHYFSALAMAYSTPGITTTQRNTLIRNMERVTRELRFVQEMTMYVPHPTEDRYWEARDFMGDLNFDGTPFVTEASPTNIAHLRESPGDWQVMRMRTSPWGTLSNWLAYANDPATGPRSYGHGYLNAIPPHHIVGNEAYLGYSDAGNGVWAPFYGLHKVLAGMLEIYYLFEDDPAIFNITNAAGPGLEDGQTEVTIAAQQLADNALQIATDMGLWIENRFRNRSQEGLSPQGTAVAGNRPGWRSTIWGQYIAGEYGGINETLARMTVIYAEKYAEAEEEDKDALRVKRERLEYGVNVFWNDGNTSSHGGIRFFTSLANNLDSIRRLHANTHIPMMVGSVWAFRASTEFGGDDPVQDRGPMYWRMADNFLDYNVGRYSWATGNVKGHRDNIETYVGAYNQVPELHAHTGANETCANYNLMKLNKYLNEHNPTDAKYLDHIEKLFICQMVGSTRIGATNGSNTYHYPVHNNVSKSRGGSQSPDMSCCAGTAIENHVKYQDAIYFESLDAYGKSDGRVLYVGLYKPSTMQWRDESGALRATIRQAAVWPSERSVFTVTPPGGGTATFEMMFRVPAWATSDFDITINGVSIAPQQEPPGVFTPSTYATTGVRTWTGTEEIVVTMPFDFWIDFLPTRHTNGMWVGAMMYGPVLMATTGISSWAASVVEVDSFLSTGAGTNITLNAPRTVAAGEAGNINAPSVAVNNVPTLTIRTGTTNMAGGTNRTFFPHYIVENGYTTYFYIRYIDENVADRNALFAMLSYAAPFLAGNFTPETLAGLQSAISAAVLVYQNIGTTDAQLNAQVALVDAAVDALEAEGEADKTELIAAIEAAVGREEVNYTWDSWAAFAAQLNSAIALRDNEYATQGAVISQTNALIAATGGLVATASLNRQVLIDALETADMELAINLTVPEELKEWPEHEFTVYTSRSTRALLAAHEEALAVYMTPNANQSEIDAAAAALNTAILGLMHYTLADERHLLRDIIDEAIALAEDIEQFTEASQAALLLLLEVGEDRYIYASLTFLEKHSTIADFREIIDNLVLFSIEPVTSIRIDLAAITRVGRNSTREVAVNVNAGADPAEAANIVLTTSNAAMAVIGEDGRSVTTFNRAGTVTLTAIYTQGDTTLRHSVTLMIT